MSVTHPAEVITQVALQPLGIDQERGKQGIFLFIATEASLFVILFFAYFFLCLWRLALVEGGAPEVHFSADHVGRPAQ